MAEATTYLCRTAAATPPTMVAATYTHRELKVVDMMAGPSARSGLTAPPVTPPPMRTAATRAKPIAGEATEAGDPVVGGHGDDDEHQQERDQRLHDEHPGIAHSF